MSSHTAIEWLRFLLVVVLTGLGAMLLVAFLTTIEGMLNDMFVDRKRRK